MKRPDWPRQRGFSLLELLVAFSIMAMALGMLYRAAGGGMHSVGEVDRYQRAALLAQSILDQRDSVTQEGWSDSGESSGYTWNVRSTPYPSTVSNPQAIVLHDVAITISWGEGQQARQLALSTLRPERKPPPGGVIR